MKKEKQHLDFYKSCIENNNQMPQPGLCKAAYFDLIDGVIFYDYLTPDIHELKELHSEGHNGYFWASGHALPLMYQFTPLRQIIVLFMAAIAGEL